MTARTSRRETVIRMMIIGAGLLAVGFGLWQVVQQPLPDLISAGAWFIAPAVLSDLVLLPAVALVGAVLTRRLAPSLRLPAQVALVLIGSLTLIALPFLTGLGRQPDNASLLNRNYPLGLAVYALVVVVSTGIWALMRRNAAHRSAGRSPDAGTTHDVTW